MKRAIENRVKFNRHLNAGAKYLGIRLESWAFISITIFILTFVLEDLDQTVQTAVYLAWAIVLFFLLNYREKNLAEGWFFFLLRKLRKRRAKTIICPISLED
jgi:hypothetical protein